jgi:hypothetical protein
MPAETRPTAGGRRCFLEGLMFQFVRRIVAALLNRRRPFGPPPDPYATVWKPRRRNPNGRSSAVALAEPEPRKRVQAVGRAGTPGISHRNQGRVSQMEWRKTEAAMAFPSPSS